jgi:hypothetical protein
MCASAALYAATDAIPPFPYLWFDGVVNAHGAQDRLVDLFSGDQPPTYVVIFQDPIYCNPSGEVATILNERYVSTTTIDGLPVLTLG